MTQELKTKTFKMDEETEAHLVDLATQDERSQAAEVRFLVNAEWQRRAVARTAAGLRDPQPRYHPCADADMGAGSTPNGSAGVEA